MFYPISDHGPCFVSSQVYDQISYFTERQQNTREEGFGDKSLGQEQYRGRWIEEFIQRQENSMKKKKTFGN